MKKWVASAALVGTAATVVASLLKQRNEKLSQAVSDEEEALAEAAAVEFGAWKSPITSELIVQGQIRLSDIRIVDHYVFWVELRPLQSGRSVLVRHNLKSGNSVDLTPQPYSVRTTVHEYGGASYYVLSPDRVVFSNMKDQDLHLARVHQYEITVHKLDNQRPELRFADGVLRPDSEHETLALVLEDHTDDTPAAVENRLVLLSVETGSVVSVIDDQHDFVMNPSFSRCGKFVAYVAWNHPNLPWDNTSLIVAELDDSGAVKSRYLVAGGNDGNESIRRPKWTEDGSLLFMSDRTGWYNIHHASKFAAQPENTPRNIVNILPKENDFAGPSWSCGPHYYDIVKGSTVFCTFHEEGYSKLAVVDIDGGTVTELPSSPAVVTSMCVSDDGMQALVLGSDPSTPATVYLIDLEDPSTSAMLPLRSSFSSDLDENFVSVPNEIEFVTKDGQIAYALYYAPKNGNFHGSERSRPPLLIKIHGGPTSNASPSFRLDIQYWTSRGYAVADVNYRGSSGYGRAYRQSLNGQWGVFDVDDVASCAKYLAENDVVNPERICIDGGSAGGYTTLAALAFTDVFSAGTSLYGVSDLTALAKDTHKFESRYLDNLVGPYPKCKHLYTERSPINHVDKINCPILILQGDEDKIVTPNQAQMMFEAVKAKGIPVAMMMFEGEQHGFRKANNIKTALDSEFLFFCKVFGITPADTIAEFPIENL